MRRVAKRVVIDLSSGDRIVVQPRFTGALLLSTGPLPEREARYTTLHATLDDGRDLHYRDIRRLGSVALMSPCRFAGYVGTQTQSRTLRVGNINPNLSASSYEANCTLSPVSADLRITAPASFPLTMGPQTVGDITIACTLPALGQPRLGTLTCTTSDPMRGSMRSREVTAATRHFVATLRRLCAQESRHSLGAIDRHHFPTGNPAGRGRARQDDRTGA